MRVFTVVEVYTRDHRKGKANTGGRFTGKTPVGAAKKAVNRICRNSDIRGRCAINIKIKEITPNSSERVFSYHVVRMRKEKGSDTIVRGGVEIHVKYSLKATAISNVKTPFSGKKASVKTTTTPKGTKQSVSRKLPTLEELEAYSVSAPIAPPKLSPSVLGQPQPAVPPYTQQQAIFRQKSLPQKTSVPRIVPQQVRKQQTQVFQQRPVSMPLFQGGAPQQIRRQQRVVQQSPVPLLQQRRQQGRAPQQVRRQQQQQKFQQSPVPLPLFQGGGQRAPTVQGGAPAPTGIGQQQQGPVPFLQQQSKSQGKQQGQVPQRTSKQQQVVFQQPQQQKTGSTAPPPLNLLVGGAGVPSSRQKQGPAQTPRLVPPV